MQRARGIRREHDVDNGEQRLQRVEETRDEEREQDLQRHERYLGHSRQLHWEVQLEQLLLVQAHARSDGHLQFRAQRDQRARAL